MEQFSLEKYLENPSRKVITKDGRVVKILDTEFESGNGNKSVLAKCIYNNKAAVYVYTTDGKANNIGETENDLFFADEKEELTGLQTTLEESANDNLLEEEIENYIKNSLAIKFPTTDKEQIKADIRYIARYFAHWQHGKDFDDLLQSEMEFPKEFYEKGRTDMREEMMKDAVKCDVIKNGNKSDCLVWKDDTAFKRIISKLNNGDKVKIIIVKEE